MCPLLSTQKYGSELCCDLIEADQFHASNTFFSEIRAGIIPDFFFSVATKQLIPREVSGSIKFHSGVVRVLNDIKRRRIWLT